MPSLKSRITEASLEKQNARLRAENRRLEKHLEVADSRLAAARAAKFRPVKATKSRARLAGDVIRMICSDVHGAKMDRKAVAVFLADVRRIQPQEIYLLGDIVDCGGFLASHHVWGYVADSTYTYDDDVLAANVFLDQLREAAPNARIEFIEGNHEQRVERWCITSALRGGNPRDAEGLRKRNAPEFLLKLAEREIPYYRMGVFYDGLNVPGTIKRGKMHYTHGSFVTAKHATARVLSQFAGNVSFANTHREQAERVRRVGVGIIGAYNAGCLCELQPLWQNTNPTDWSQGFGLELSARSGAFLRFNVPIIDGVSYLGSLLSTHEQQAA